MFIDHTLVHVIFLSYPNYSAIFSLVIKLKFNLIHKHKLL